MIVGVVNLTAFKAQFMRQGLMVRSLFCRNNLTSPLKNLKGRGTLLYLSPLRYLDIYEALLTAGDVPSQYIDPGGPVCRGSPRNISSANLIDSQYLGALGNRMPPCALRDTVWSLRLES